MSGHSKWAQIKRSKAVTDKKKGQLFSKLSREISIAAKNGGDPAINFKLRLVLDRAKDAGMPKDNLDRAIKRGTGEGKTLVIEDIVYEGYGPGGTAFLIQAATDNKNRTVNNIKHIFSEHEGSLGTQGSVNFLFTARGQILVPREGNQNLDEISLAAIDLGAEDVRQSEEGLEIYTIPLDVEKIKNDLERQGAKIATYEVIMQPQTTIDLDETAKQKVLNLIDALENEEDVISVHTNTNL